MKRALSLSVLLFLSCNVEAPRAFRGPAQRHDALSANVVISEVYGGGLSTGSAYRYDFVELFNRGTTAVDVTNWSVQYTGATSGAWQVTSLGNFGLLQPGHFLLVRMGTQGTGLALPAHDVSGGSLMSNSAGKVALVNNSTGLTTACPASSSWVDLVAYGPTANCSEGSPTPSPAVDQSLQRRLQGCRETDDNAADFFLGAPTPMNSMSPMVDCATAMDPDAGCRVLAAWPTTSSVGSYVAMDGVTTAELRNTPTDGGDFDRLTLELYWGDAGVALPTTENYGPGSTYGACTACSWIGEGCDPVLGCQRFYFQQSGSVTVSVASRNELNGRMTGSVNAASFVEWDFGTDAPVSGGGCIELAAQNVDVTWGSGATGGGGGGSPTGGGAATGGGTATGGGAGGGGGASVDAGTDAGTDAGAEPSDAGTGDKLKSKSGCGCSSLDATLVALALVAVGRRHRRR
ncbi:MAG: lamin tail domain-containing protein [Myxococcaceae bacterium]